jgi:hypothetical protein
MQQRLTPHGPKAPAKLFRRARGECGITVGNREHFYAGLRHISPRKAVNQTQREHPVALTCRHLVDQSAQRLRRGRKHAHDLTIVRRHHRPRTPFCCVDTNAVEIARAINDVDMRIFFIRDDRIGVGEHGRGEMRVEIEFRADHRPLPGNCASTL